MDKKGSMQLGINAIVILIIALAILGLAMTFVTKLFTQGEGRLGSIISSVNLPVHADSSTPLKMDTGMLSVKQKSDDNTLIVSVYNSNKFKNDENVFLHIDCSKPEGGVEEGISLVSPSQKIPLGRDVGYGAIISLTDDVIEGTYPCRVIASIEDSTTAAIDDTESISGQLFIKVVS